MTDPLSTVFDHMDRWRHLPAYQLERRADLFFSAYLPAVLTAHTGVPVSPDLLPELPIRRDLIWPDRPTRASVKVDYVALAADRSRAFFVELKTDGASRRDSQDTYLSRSVEVGFRRILQGIVEISQATSAHQKYGHLLRLLADQGCLRLPDALAGYLWPTPRPGLSRLLREIEVTARADEFAIEVIYVQPAAVPGDRCIDFAQFAAHVEQLGDPLSARFAASLRRWVERAGAPAPD